MKPVPIHPLERNRMSTAGTNKILFERANIKVTHTRFDNGFETFPIKKISGVKIEVAKRRTRVGIAFVVAGAVSLLAGLLTSFPVLIVAGAAFTVGGVMMCFARVNSSVLLTSRGGHDVKALTSKDTALIQSVASAIREAIERHA